MQSVLNGITGLPARIITMILFAFTFFPVKSQAAVIEAEDYRTGGEGVAYHDVDAANNGGYYHPSEGVDIDTIIDGGHYVGWLRNGEWIKYPLKVDKQGIYVFSVRCAALHPNGRFHININGMNKTGNMQVVNTMELTGFNSMAAEIDLSPADTTFELYVDSGEFNVDKFSVDLKDGVATTGELIGENSARFYPAGTNPDSYPVTMAFVNEPRRTNALPAGWNVVPKVRREGKRLTYTLDVAAGTSLYGTGEIAGPLKRNGKFSCTWNHDAPAYSANTASLYQTHPWVLAVRADGSAYGILANTTYRCEINLTQGIQFSAEGADYFCVVIEGASPQEVLTRLSGLIGTMTLPPLWAMGYQQCRFSYHPDSKVREIADGFRNRKIPCDVIWMDIDYMDAYKIFTFRQDEFPDPKGLNDYLHQSGFHSVWMIDPGVSVVPGYFVYEQGTAGNHWTTTASGAAFTGKVWPEKVNFPDFTRPETRQWWSGLYKEFMAQGVDGVWNDMNEPSVFNSDIGGNGTMPVDAVHRGGGVLEAAAHGRYHNMYGMLMTMASNNGIRAAAPDKRPFLLSRSNFIGGQRYAACWTGDNYAAWDNLEWSIGMILNMGLSGQPFTGPDIGGFLGTTSAQLFARWIGVGAFFPFSRAHKVSGEANAEPWAFDTHTEDVSRLALQRRYRLLPYLYTLFRESSVNGLPVMRPVFFADPADPQLRDEDEAFLLGSSLLVHPNIRQSGTPTLAEPRGIWRKMFLIDETAESATEQPQLKIRGGSIVPAGRIVQNTTESFLDTLTLYVSLDDKFTAEGKLYEDDGDGWDFTNGDYLLTTYRAEASGSQVHISISKTEGSRPRPNRVFQVQVLTDQGTFSGSGSESYGFSFTVPAVALKNQPKLTAGSIPAMSIHGSTIRIYSPNGKPLIDGVVSLYSVSGKKMLEQSLAKGKTSMQLSLSECGFSRGVYLCILQGPAGFRYVKRVQLVR
jgi:alpha-glucosidase